MGGDKKPSHRYFERGGHGKTVIAECTLTEEAIRRVLRTTPEDLLDARLRRDARRRRLRDAVGRVHAGDGDRRDLHRDRPGHRHGRDELDGPRHRRAASRAASRRSACPASRSATVGGGTTLPVRARLARPDGLRRPGQGLPLRPDRGRRDARARDLRVGGDGDRRLGELLPGPPRARRPALATPPIPPHHDPPAWGCGDNPVGLHLPLPTRRASTATRRTFALRRAPPGRARASCTAGLVARRARRGLRPPRDLAPLPGGDGAHLRPLPPARADQPRAASRARSIERARAAHPRRGDLAGRRDRSPRRAGPSCTCRSSTSSRRPRAAPPASAGEPGLRSNSPRKV